MPTQFTLDLTNVPSIASSALLVEVSISTWTGRKKDRAVSEEVMSQKSATSKRAASVTKSLFADSQSLLRIQSIANEVRGWVYGVTLPWSDNGLRLIPTSKFFDFKVKLDEYEKEFDTAVQQFLDEYGTLVAAAAFKLGDLFDRNEYPDPEEVRPRFRLRYSFYPVPDAGDFRVSIGQEAVKDLQEQFVQRYTEKVDEAMRDAWSRLHECLLKLQDRLALTNNGDKKVFRDTLVGNTTELCEVLAHLNITGDPKLEDARRQLQRSFTSVTPEVLRQNDAVRASVRAEVDDILSKFNW